MIAMSNKLSRNQSIEYLHLQVNAGRDLLNKSSFKYEDYLSWRTSVEFGIRSLFGMNSQEEKMVFLWYQPDGKGDYERIRVYPSDRSEALSRHLMALNSLLLAMDHPENSGAKDAEKPSKHIGNRIFIVHGHNDGPKLAVASYLGDQGFEVIILHAMPNSGRTIIEKFEDYSDVGFAVVLLTADDRGGSIKSETLRPRARQNVIFELGFFYGKLGRHLVCALLEEGVEKPSDIDGVVYTPYDKSERWKLDLAKELTAAGYSVDLNKG